MSSAKFVGGKCCKKVMMSVERERRGCDMDKAGVVLRSGWRGGWMV